MKLFHYSHYRIDKNLVCLYKIVIYAKIVFSR